MMKVRNLLFGAIVAMLPMAIASCDKEKEETTPSTSVDVTKVVGTYEGYTLASSAYFQNNFTADESLTVAKSGDKTVDITFASGTWGTTTVTNATVSASGSRYTVTGNGTCVMQGMGGERSYDCTLTADIASTADATVTVSLPAVMCGTNVVFKTGKASTGYYVADKYRGDIDVSVNGSSQLTINDTIMTLNAKEGDKVDIVTPEMGLSMGAQQMSLPSTTFENIAVTTADFRTFTIAQQPVSITVGSTNWTGTVEGTVANGVLSLTFVVTPGAMPMPITITFATPTR
ncbi:MAG: hypothetical protein IKQ94_02790 [Bacteroidales bacterium]|nr:hypothetical protein [Bacteroidales bacterium]